MKRSAPWIVEDEGIRPVGDPDKCFYCRRPKGSEHTEECVIRTRTVVCKMTIDIVMEVPESSTPDQIEFHINDSSSCVNNIVEKMSEQLERWNEVRDKEGASPCFCFVAEGKFLREATEDDEEWAGIRAEEFRG